MAGRRWDRKSRSAASPMTRVLRQASNFFVVPRGQGIVWNRCISKWYKALVPGSGNPQVPRAQVGEPDTKSLASLRGFFISAFTRRERLRPRGPFGEIQGGSGNAMAWFVARPTQEAKHKRARNDAGLFHFQLPPFACRRSGSTISLG